MPRLIFKCPYIKGGTSSATAHLENYVKYMATRNGVERIDPGRSGWPATSKQKKMVEQILRDFPLSRGMFEYEDYAAEPTRANASEFITRALEDNYDQIAKKDNYLKYIATRPRAQRVGSHGLFTGEEDQLVLAQVAEAVAAHPGNVWLPIISLRREDAARLGYDKAEEWKALLSKYAMEMAEAMKIPWEDFRWYAAFHDEAHHPHIHMVCYSADPSKGFLTTQGIAQIKSGLAKEIFRQELTELYQKQTQSIPKDVIAAIRWLTAAAKQESGYAEYALALVYLTGEDAPKDSVKALSLLKRSAGRGNQFAQYRLGKLLLQGEDAPKDVKAAIRWLTAAAEQGNQYAQYALGKLYLLGKEVPKDRSSAIKWFQLATDQGNEYAQYFLEHMDDRLGQPPVAAVISLFHHLANIFQEQNQPPPSGGVRVAVDRKLLRKIKAKKIAQGHKADDHEPEMQL